MVVVVVAAVVLVVVVVIVSTSVDWVRCINIMHMFSIRMLHKSPESYVVFNFRIRIM